MLSDAGASDVDPSCPSGAYRRSPSGSSRALAIGWLTSFTLALLVYVATANRGVQWQDSGDRMLRVLIHDPVGRMGLALSHPLHHWLGRLAVWPGVVEPSLATTLVSACFGAMAIANVFGCVWSITRRTGPAAFAAASLAVAHTFWQMSTLTETYTLTSALLAGECWCLIGFAQGRRWCMPAMFLLNGLGVSNHLLASLTTPILIIATFVGLRRRLIDWRSCGLAAVLWIIGSGLYASMVVTTLLNTGDLPGTLRSALFGFAYAENVLNTRITPGMLARSLAFVTYNYPNLLLPAALYGIMRGGRLHCGAGPGMLDRRTSAPAPFIDAGLPPLARWALLGGLLIHAAFVLRYDIKDQYTFFLPLYVMLAIHGGMGAALVLGWVHLGHKRKIAIAAWVCLLLTPVVYVATPAVARRIHLLDGFARRPYRDSYRYLFVPWSVAEHSAERMAVEAISLAGPQGLILSEDRMGAFALEYKKVRLGLDDLELQALPGQGSLVGRTRLTSMLQQAANAGRRVVLVPTDARALAPQQTIPGMSWSRRGDLWLLVPVSAPASSQAAGS